MVSNAEDPWSDSRIERAATIATAVTKTTIVVAFLNRALVREVIAINESDLYMVDWPGRSRS
jgi:hypothetical protein